MQNEEMRELKRYMIIIVVILDVSKSGISLSSLHTIHIRSGWYKNKFVAVKNF